MPFLFFNCFNLFFLFLKLKVQKFLIILLLRFLFDLMKIMSMFHFARIFNGQIMPMVFFLVQFLNFNLHFMFKSFVFFTNIF